MKAKRSKLNFDIDISSKPDVVVGPVQLWLCGLKTLIVVNRMHNEILQMS
jgi:hypothetical protein